MYDLDLFVIGAGSGGVRAARTAAALGAKVAVAEELYLGGTCVNVGCVPKKLYSYAAKYRDDFKDSAGFGWKLSEPVFNWQTLRDNKKAEIARLNGIYQHLLETAGVTIYPAKATITGPNQVSVNGKQITARYILIATGGWPFVPDFTGKEHALTSNEIFDLPVFPKRLLVIGGGYIAVEFAGIFSGLGSQTSLSYRGDKLLKGFDEDIRTHFMSETGKHMNLLLNTNVSSISKAADKSLLVTLENGQTLTADVVLSATGRKAKVEGLGLEHTAVKITKSGHIDVNKQFQTAEASIYALGDVVGHMALTPVALAEGMFIADQLFGSGKRSMSYHNIPTAVFCHPNIATVGMSEDQAKEQFGQVTVYESEFRHLKHTLSGNKARTYMKLVVDTASDKIVGMHMLGDDAGEIIQGFAAAMQAGVTKQQLDSTIGIHPTAAEEFVTMRTARK